MHEVVASPLRAWESFYVIVGSSAGALTGLQFVVLTLIGEAGGARSKDAIAAFGSPNCAGPIALSIGSRTAGERQCDVRDEAAELTWASFLDINFACSSCPPQTNSRGDGEWPMRPSVPQRNPFLRLGFPTSP